eukprot:111753-Pleurochrysis_carterae.AAC.4
MRARRVPANPFAESWRQVRQHLVACDELRCFGRGCAEDTLIRPTPVIAARRARSSCVDMSTCLLLLSIAHRESAPSETGDSKMKLPPQNAP